MNKNRIFDNLASLVSEAADTAKGMGKEAQAIFNTQLEKALMKLDLVKQEEFERLQTMVSNLSIENIALKKRLTSLEEHAGLEAEEQAGLEDANEKKEATPAKVAATTIAVE